MNDIVGFASRDIRIPELWDKCKFCGDMVKAFMLQITNRGKRNYRGRSKRSQQIITVHFCEKCCYGWEHEHFRILEVIGGAKEKIYFLDENGDVYDTLIPD
jgi:hypothetical protein